MGDGDMFRMELEVSSLLIQKQFWAPDEGFKIALKS